MDSTESNSTQLIGAYPLCSNMRWLQKNHVPAFTKQGFLKEKIPQLLFKKILSKLVFLSMAMLNGVKNKICDDKWFSILKETTNCEVGFAWTWALWHGRWFCCQLWGAQVYCCETFVFDDSFISWSILTKMILHEDSRDAMHAPIYAGAHQIVKKSTRCYQKCCDYGEDDIEWQSKKFSDKVNVFPVCGGKLRFGRGENCPEQQVVWMMIMIMIMMVDDDGEMWKGTTCW